MNNLNKNAPLVARTTSKATPINDLHGNINQPTKYTPCLMCESKPTFLNAFDNYEPPISLCRACVDKIYKGKGQKFVNKVIRKAKAEARR